MTAKATNKPKPSKATKTTDAAADDLKFEHAMAELEEVVRKLEGGDVPLEESLAAFEKGVSLVRTLHNRLDNVQEKIEQLTAGSRGEPSLEPLVVDDD
jgi:exodeoxyribonuclease VII small subunit